MLTRNSQNRKRHAESGLDDLPTAVAVAIEQSLAAQESAPSPAPPKAADSTVEELVTRLEAIKNRIFRLAAMWAITLSDDVHKESVNYRRLFQQIAAQLREKNAVALDRIVAGHEELLLDEPVLIKRTIPLDLQRSCELRWEIGQSPARRVPPRPTVGDGLDWLVG